MHKLKHSKDWKRDFPDGSVVKNSPSSAGDAGSILGKGTKIPQAVGQLRLYPATREPVHSRAHAPYLGRSTSASVKDPMCSS